MKEAEIAGYAKKSGTFVFLFQLNGMDIVFLFCSGFYGLCPADSKNFC